MTKRAKTAIFSLFLVLTLIMPLVLQETVDVKAASKKTVRVATEKQLKAALKDTKVGTIVLRTSSYKDITIKSGKTKKKKIIIDAPNAIVTNTARFKNVEVIKANEYIEAVSGNTVKLSSDVHLQVAEGVSVKKLVSSDAPVYYDIQKNGLIKSIVITDKNHKSTFDKETRTLTFETVGVSTSYALDYDGNTENPVTEEYPIQYSAVLDESGRKLKSSYADWASDYCEKYRYDENGNCIEWKRYDVRSGDPELTDYYDYVYEENRLVEETDHSSEPDGAKSRKVYDKDGRLAETNDSSPYYSEDAKYTYDKNGLLICEETTKMWFSGDGRLSSRKSIRTNYTYDKNGFLLIWENYLIDDHTKNIITYEYDKAKNMIHETRISKDSAVSGDELVYNELEFSYEYDELGAVKSMY